MVTLLFDVQIISSRFSDWLLCSFDVDLSVFDNLTCFPAQKEVPILDIFCFRPVVIHFSKDSQFSLYGK